MNRRQVLRGLLAGVATVAIGMKLASKMPELPKQEPIEIKIKWGGDCTNWSIYNIYAPILKPEYWAVRMDSVTA